MFKNFHGFQLVDEYHQWKKEHRQNNNPLQIKVLCVTGIITKRDLEELSWSILWMVAGGFALGVALQESGLAQHLITSIPFGTWSPLVVVIGSGVLCYLMANFISHTATAALFIPILAIAWVKYGSQTRRTRRYRNSAYWGCNQFVSSHDSANFHSSQCPCRRDGIHQAKGHGHHGLDYGNNWTYSWIYCTYDFWTSSTSLMNLFSADRYYTDSFHQIGHYRACVEITQARFPICC